MPLPADEQVVKVSQDLINQLKAAFGSHPGFRPAHARGIMLTGAFVPTPEAASLSSVPHLNAPSTPVVARFSSSTGIPNIPDTDLNANPRGLGLRFVLGEHKHTDIVAHSTNGFPTRTGAEFLEMLQALGASGPDVAHPSPIEKFLGSHPSALKFVQAPKPAPTSFAKEEFFAVNAFRFVNSKGESKFVRYHIIPEAGVETLDEAGIEAKEANFLFDEVPEHIAKGPISFQINVQVAEDGDVTDDATVHWPEDRKVVNIGKFTLDKLVEDTLAEQKKIIFDPVPRVDGIEPSADPLLDVRAAVYLLSGRERRKA